MESPSSHQQRSTDNSDPISMPMLRGLLELPKEVTFDSTPSTAPSTHGSGSTTAAKAVKRARQALSVHPAHSGLNTSTPKLKNIVTTSSTTLLPRVTPYFGPTNNERGEKITTATLATYLSQQKIYDAEGFIAHATQGPENRGTQLYLKLAMKDWDKKLQQALDIARSFTPDTPYKQRLENYTITEPDLIGDYTYQEYMQLFAHHGITIPKIQRWFQTLFSDNGKRNTIYMWGKADAGKSTIIKLFDAFYAKWEIGRCSAQSINSNFWLQDLFEKRLFHADEIIATQVNIDTLKLLLEGSDDLTTDIKYAKKVSIIGRPVLMATNDPIWIHMSTAGDPIRRRCEWIHMTRPWTKKCMYMHTRNKNILKYALRRLYDECFPNGYDQWKHDNDYKQTIDQMWEDIEVAIENIEGESLDNYVSEMN